MPTYPGTQCPQIPTHTVTALADLAIFVLFCVTVLHTGNIQQRNVCRRERRVLALSSVTATALGSVRTLLRRRRNVQRKGGVGVKEREREEKERHIFRVSFGPDCITQTPFFLVNDSFNQTTNKDCGLFQRSIFTIFLKPFSKYCVVSSNLSGCALRALN